MPQGAERDLTGPSVRVVCVGETMVMFSPEPPQLIEHATQFTSYLGGAEVNVAIGLERLDLHSGWIGKLPRNALGRRIINETRAHGVDTSAVVWTDQGRVGTFFFEWGAAPRPHTTLYDRAHSAAATMTADDPDWEYLRRAEWLHMTGIMPALSATCRAATREIMERAKRLGLSVSLDVNYRELLWGREEAREALRELLPFVDLLIATETDAAMLLGHEYGREEALERLMEDSAHRAVVLTLEEEGSIGSDGNAVFSCAGHPVASVVNRVGAGDAFVAGLLYGYITSDLEAGLRYGSAMAALKLTIRENIPLVRREDVERLVAGRSVRLVR